MNDLRLVIPDEGIFNCSLGIGSIFGLTDLILFFTF